MTLIFFWGGGRGWRGEMENCAYLRKNPGYAPGIKYNYTKENPKEQNVLTYSLVPFLDIEFPYLMKIFNF